MVLTDSRKLAHGFSQVLCIFEKKSGMSGIKLALIILIVPLIELFSQEPAASPSWLKANILGVENLSAHKDTGRMKVVSASRSTKYVSDLPITIYVVTRDEIIRNHYTTLTDVLKSLPGIRVSIPGSGELGNSYQVRGLTGNFYTKILLNGLPVKPSVVSGMPLGDQLPVRQAERIEIIYGPGAAIYGADAVSGVINIITRQAEEGTFVQGDISLGQTDFNYINFMIGGKAGKNRNILKYSFYANKSEQPDLYITKGYADAYNPLNYLQNIKKSLIIDGTVYNPLEIDEDLLRANNVTPVDFIHEYYPLNYEGSLIRPELEDLSSASHMIGLQLDFRGVKLSYDNMYRRTHSSIGKSAYLYKYNNPQNFWADFIRKATLSYDLSISNNLQSTTNLSNLWYYMDNNSSLGLTYLHNTDNVYLFSASKDFLGEQIFTFSPSVNMEVITGLTWQRSKNLPVTNYLSSPWDYKKNGLFANYSPPYDSILGSFGFNPLTFNEISGFTQMYLLLKKWTIMGGVRIDRNSNYKMVYNPRFAVQKNISDNTTLFGSLGFAFKAPPSNLAYQSIAFPAPQEPTLLTYLMVPNPNLMPEKFQASELGIRTLLYNKINLNIAIYYNEIRNLIMDKYIRAETLDLPYRYIESPGDSILYRDNIKNAVSRLYGIQVTGKWNDIFPALKSDLELNLSFAQKSEKIPGLTDIPELLGGFKLMPKHFGQIKFSLYPVEKFYINIESVWMSKWLRVILPFEDLFPDIFKDIDGFYLMDVTANYRIGENLRTFIRINNLFDEKYGGLGVTGLATDLPYNPQMRRHIRIGLTFNLN